jgi:TRAP-type C4-dicarboxylate transport system permease small subunit
MMPNPPEPILTILLSILGLFVLLYLIVLMVDLSQGVFKKAPLYTIITTPFMQAFIYINVILPVAAVLAILYFLIA